VYCKATSYIGLDNPALAKDGTYGTATGQPKFLSSIELLQYIQTHNAPQRVIESLIIKGSISSHPFIALA
jgi:hypothetical protein